VSLDTFAHADVMYATAVVGGTRQRFASPLRVLDPPGALPLIAITGATGFRTTLVA
jgi:hypothetical protein